MRIEYERWIPVPDARDSSAVIEFLAEVKVAVLQPVDEAIAPQLRRNRL